MAACPHVRSRGGFVLVAALAIDSVGNGLFAPLSLVYFVRLTDVPLAVVGVLLTVANLVALPVPVWAGALADRIGPRPLVVAVEAAMALGFLAFAAVYRARSGSWRRRCSSRSGCACSGARSSRWSPTTPTGDPWPQRRWRPHLRHARRSATPRGSATRPAPRLASPPGWSSPTAAPRATARSAYGAAAFLALAAVLVAVGVRAPHQAGAADGPAATASWCVTGPTSGSSPSTPSTR